MKVFRKDVTYNKVKCRKKQGFTISLENTFLEKTQEGGRGGGGGGVAQVTPSMFRVNISVKRSPWAVENSSPARLTQ